MSLSSIYVPSEGPRNAKIAIVGEAPGRAEEKAKRPFVYDSDDFYEGAAGRLLNRYLGRAGVLRSQVYLTNISKYRPDGNKFQNILSSGRLPDFVAELREELDATGANVIMAAGAWPMWVLTHLVGSKKNAKPGSGVFQWRGSIVPSTLCPDRKVVVSLHPAYVARREGFKYHGVFMEDIKRVVRESAYPEIRYPAYDEYIDPPIDILEQVVHEMWAAPWLSVDIETFGDKLACIGFADSEKRGLCLTRLHSERNWQYAEQLLASPARKIFQYGMYDVNYLKWYLGWATVNYFGVGWDTYIAQNILYPGFPKTLQFLASIYTDFPFYKEDRKIWKEKGDLNIFWRYNIKDIIATYIIAMKQMEEMQEMYPALDTWREAA